MQVAGQVIGGSFGSVLIRQKEGIDLEIGDLMVSDEGQTFLILQVFDLEFGSQIESRMRQMMSGMNLEEIADSGFYEPEFANYVLARLKPLARVSSGRVALPKSMPKFFNKLRLVASSDLAFLKKGDDHIFLGQIRSGSKTIPDTEVWLPAQDVFSHHILIPATTGRGKSNLVKTILWHTLDTNRVGALVLDAHDEYYGRDGLGLKDHPRSRDNLVYYTPSSPPVGARHLIVNLKSIRPEHFDGIVDFSEAQSQAILLAWRRHRKNWIKEFMLEDPAPDVDGSGRPAETKASTKSAVQRKLRVMLNLEKSEDGSILSKSDAFDSESKGEGTVDGIVGEVESGKVVILDTSRLGDEAELLVGNIIAGKLLQNYRDAKATGRLGGRPVATVVIEEAPRVIGEDVLTSRNDNIYATIAKEGRKFKVGLTAITQLSSVIPKAILANMNTKIILGNEMKQEREALIASASQDLTEDDKNISSLDRGEAIITSIFVPFAMPIKIPLFDEVAKREAAPGEQGRIRVF